MSSSIYDAIFAIAAVLELPVVILALVSLGVVLYELGAFGVELWRRRRRHTTSVVEAGDLVRDALARRDTAEVLRVLRPVARSARMTGTMTEMVATAGAPDADIRIAKQLADFDFGSQRRLGRTRLLVRTGPALGLMGTLIPLAPALDGLARGDVAALSQNLRVAFSVTVLGLLVGALAFAISLTRDRLYGQDYSDLEYVAAVLTSTPYPSSAAPPAAPAPNDGAIGDGASNGGAVPRQVDR